MKKKRTSREVGLLHQLKGELSRRARRGHREPPARGTDTATGGRQLQTQNDRARGLLLDAMPWLPADTSLVHAARAAMMLITIALTEAASGYVSYNNLNGDHV